MRNVQFLNPRFIPQQFYNPEKNKGSSNHGLQSVEVRS